MVPDTEAAQPVKDIFKVGDEILYVPDLGHWHERDAAGKPLFDFVHAEDGPPAPVGRKRAMKGDLVEDSAAVLRTAESQGADGMLLLTNGNRVRVLCAKCAWSGIVVEEVERVAREVSATVEGEERVVIVHDEKRRLVLNVKHPNGFLTLHLPLDGPSAVAHDPNGKKPHSWHRAKEVTQ